MTTNFIFWVLGQKHFLLCGLGSIPVRHLIGFSGDAETQWNSHEKTRSIKKLLEDDYAIDRKEL